MTRSLLARLALPGLVLAAVLAGALPAAAQERVLAREDILLYGIGLRVEPATQTVPKDFATIVSAFLQTSQAPGALPPLAPDAEVRATLRGPSFARPIDLVAAANTPLQIPVLSVPGTHTVENIRLVSNGQVLLYGTPEVARIEVIEKLLVTTVTTRALTADEIRERGIVFDRSNFQAYNFTAAFAIDDGSRIDISFPVVLPTLVPPEDVRVGEADLPVNVPQLQSLRTLVPDTLRIQQRIPNLQVVGFLLKLDEGAPQSQNLVLPPIPGVIVIPGDIGFLNQFFSVMLMVANVAPTGSNLVVRDLQATIVLPPGTDNVVGSDDDPLRMARRATGEFPRVVVVTQPGADGKLGTADDITTLGPGETGNAEYLVEGRREGTHVVEMELSGTLLGLPVGPVPIRGRAAGAVLVRNPTFTLTFTHPDIVNAGEPYTLDITVTNTSGSPANFVSLNLFAQNLSGARLDDQPSKGIDFIAPDDSATVTFRLIAQRTGKVTAATLDSDQNVAGRFVLKSGVGEFGVPLSPDSLVLPKEATSLPAELRDATLGLLGRAWAIATAPPAALPKDLSRFSKQVVLDRGVETAEAGLRVTLGEPLARSAAALLFDFLGSEYTRLADRVKPGDAPELLSLLQRDVAGFDLVRRRSVRGDVFAHAIAGVLAPQVAAGASAFHLTLAEQMTSVPAHVSVLVTGAAGARLAFDAALVDAEGRRLGGLQDGKVVKQIPYGDVLTFTNAGGDVTGQLLVIAVPSAGTYSLTLVPRQGDDASSAYDLSVVIPGEDGRLRFASLAGLGLTDGFDLTNGSTDEATRVAVSRTASGGDTATATFAIVADPAPTVLGIRQMAGADMAGCPLDPNRVHDVGRIVAVLFSEEVTPESVHDRAPASDIVNFRPEGNRAVGVALQPGRRVAYVALREPVGPIEPRTMTVEGVLDASGNALPLQTMPIVTTNTEQAGVVSGQVLRADGTPAGFTSVRLFYEFNCGDTIENVGVAEETTDEQGRYQFDFVLKAPGMTVKLLAVDPESNDLRTVRFGLARDRQRLNVNVVFLGRGTITGRTIAQDGRTALAGTRLRATSLTDQSQYGTVSDADGRFTFGNVPVGNLLIEAVNIDRPAQIFVSENVPFAGATVTRDILLLDVNLAAPTLKIGNVTGRVVRADGVTAVRGVPAILYYRTRSQPNVPCAPPPGGRDEPSECAVAVTETGADGAFSFPAAPAGDLRVYSFDQAAQQEGTARFALAENQTFDLALLLGGGFGTVTGIVLDASGNPVTDAEVGGGLSLTRVTASGPDAGRFTLTDVPVGRREIVAVSQSLLSEGRTTVDVVQAGETVNATIVLAPTASIAGIVRSRDGVPQPGIKVWAFVAPCYDPETLAESICVEGQTTTDATGAYRFDKLPLKTYSISAFRSDFRDGNVGKVALRFANQVLRHDITFRGGFGTVTGRVLRAAPVVCDSPPCSETPLPARVGISGERVVIAGGQVGVEFKYVQNYAIVDNNFTTGEFRFNNVWVGPVTVRAAGQFSPEPVAAETVVPEAGATVDVVLRLQPTSRITGTVVESDGFTPVTNRQVSLRFKSDAFVVICSEDPLFGTECQSIPQGIQEMFAATDSQGRFTFPIVNAGPFTLTATDTTTGKVAEMKGQVRAGDVVDLTVRLLSQGRLAVNVFRSDGVTRVNNASVELRQIGFPNRTDQGLAVGGSIEFAGLSEGEYLVTARDANGFGGRKAARVTGDGETVALDVFLFDNTGTVNGQVTRDDPQQGTLTVPNAEVVLTNSAGPVAFALTDAEGQFSVDLVPTGLVTAEAFDPVSAARGRGSVTVLGSGQPASLTVRLEALGVIRGTLLQSGLLTPLPGWTVELRQVTPAGRSLPVQVTQTGVDGGFTFPGASVGSFSLRATQRNVAAVATATGQLTRGGQLVEVPLVATIDRRITGRVTGRVVTGAGAPIPNAQVEICPSGEPCRPTVTNGAGEFEQGDLPLGRFFVRASAQVTGNPSAGNAGGTLLFEDDVADVTVALLGLSVVEGTVFQVVNGVQQLAANASVQLVGQPGSGCPGACNQSTDGQGRFRFTNVPARSFTVTASNLAGQRGSVGDVITPGETKSGLQIVLAAAVSVGGRVLDAGGVPAAGIVAEFIRGGARLFVETGADGRFEFQAVQPGAFTIAFADPVGPGLARRGGTVLDVPLDLGDILLDDAAPTVVESTPADGALSVSQTPEIRARFSEPVDAGTVNAQTVTLLGPTGAVAGLVDLIEGNAVARFRLLPGAQLQDQARYTLRVSGVTDLVGRTMASDFVGRFTTLDLTPPSITETTPAPSATGVSTATTIRVRYSEMIDPTRFAGPAIVVTGPSGPLAGRVDVILGNTTVVFTPQFPLLEDTTYQVQVAPATDLSGRQQPAGLTFAFSTTDRTPPIITSLVPTSPTVIENTIVSVTAATSVTDVAFVDFFVNGTLAFTARSTPFVMALQASPQFGGPGSRLQISALATDTSGNRGTVPATAFVDVLADALPAPAIVAPAAGASAANGAQVAVQVRATDDVGVTQISYLVRRTEGPAGPVILDAQTRTFAAVPERIEGFSFAVPVNAAPGSLLTIEASARDTSGRTQSAAPIEVRVLDAVGPTVQITGVSSGQRVQPGQVVTAVVAASDPGGVARIGFSTTGVVVRNEQRDVAPPQTSAATSFQFTVPANAQSTDRVILNAFAVDTSNNRTDAAQVILPLADNVAPTVTVRTATGTLDMVPGAPVSILVEGEDDIGISRLTLSGAGAFGFSDSKTFTSTMTTASASFQVAVPGSVAPGATVTLTARAIDASGNVSAPALLTLTARVIGGVTLPGSLLLRAGESRAIDVTLDAPAPAGGTIVTLTSSATSLVTVTPSVAFAAGETTRAATVSALRGGTAQISAAIEGVTKATTTVSVIGGVLTGTVVEAGPSGFQPVAGANVTVFHGGEPRVTQSASDGTFAFEGLVGAGFSGRDLSVRANDPGRLDYKTLQLSAPGGFAEVTLILLPLGSVRGTVLLADGVTPAGPNVLVRLFEAAAPPPNGVAVGQQFTDADGAFLFPLQAPGNYVLVASQQNVDLGRADANVASGEETIANIRALARGTVEVTVLSAAGPPVTGAIVTFNSTSVLGGAPQRTGTTNAEGKVSFADVLAGSFTASASDPVTGQGGSTSGQVVTDGATVGATITLSAFGNITGTVYRADGTTPVPGATVRANCGGNCNYTRTADANGQYSFLFLPLGSYTMFASDSGTRGQGVNLSIVSFAVSGQTVSRDISLRPQGALLVTVIDADGQPINGASVTVQVASAPLGDTLSGTTGILEGQPGRVLLDRLLAGSYTVTASAAGLSGAGTPGTIVAGEVATAIVQLEARGSITLTVLDQDGQTPATGSVRISRSGQGEVASGALVGGSFTASDLRMGTYFVDAFDGAGRRRATASGVVLAANGDHPTVPLTFVALGTVRGRVIHPNVGGDVGNLTVTVQSFHASFGGFQAGQTDAAGNYEIGGVAVGQVRVTTGKPAEQLLGEANGVLTYVPPAPAVLSLDVLLQNNAVSLPTTLADANSSQYAIQQTGGLGGSNVRTFNYGGLSLSITPESGSAQSFTGATFGTRENAGREIVVRQDGLAGLNVTRKVFVPATGYFARYLELLANPSAQDVTVAVAVESRLYGGFLQFCSFQCERTHFLSATSSGDSVIDVSSATPDRWVSLGSGFDPYTRSNESASVSFVFDGEGGSLRVGSASYEALNPNVSPFLRPRLAYAWQSVTVPAGTTVGLMHFVALQAHAAAATASAQRLVQLPPEALEGLSPDEIAAIRNFVVPATGTSGIAPLPPITGTVTGQVREGDNVSVVPGATVTFTSRVPVHPRRLAFTADGGGNFSFAGAAGAPVPVADFELFATYPGTQVTSQTDTVSFPSGQSVANHTLVFRDFGIISGTVRRNGLPVSGAVVQTASRSQTTGADGRYRFGGLGAVTCVFNQQTQQCDYLPPVSYTVTGSLSHPQGTALSLSQQTVQLSPGQVLAEVDLNVEPTGTVTGVLLDAAGVPQGNRQVRLRDGTASFQRFATTNASGQFTFTDVRIGSFTVASSDPSNNLETTLPVTVTENQTTTVELRYVGNVTITVLVTRASGTPIGGMSVQVTGTGFSRPAVTTNANGLATVTDVPAGRSATVAAFHPLQASILRTTQTITTAPGQELTIALPAFGSVSGTVRRPNGALVGPGVRVDVFQGTGAPSFFYQTTTDANSRYATDPGTQPVPANVNVNVRAERPEPLSNGFTRPTLTFPNNRIAGDGQTLALDVRVPAVAAVRFTVTEAGVPVSGARIIQMTGSSEFLHGSTNAAGQLTINELVESSYVFRVRRALPSTEMLDVATVVVGPANDGGTIEVTVEVQRFTISIRGTIFQADGVTPLPSPQNVELLRAGDRRQLATVCVGGSGCAAAAGLAPGEFRITAFDARTDVSNQGPGVATGAGVIVVVRSPFFPFESPTVEQLIVPTADGEYTVTATVPVRRATIEGQVLASDGVTPAGLGSVNLDFVDNTTTRITGVGRNVNDDGTFAFTDVFLPVDGARAKLWNVAGLTNGQVSAVTGPVSSIGAVLPVTLTMPPSTFVTARGRVVAGDGVTPLQGLLVDLRYGTNLVTTVTTDGEGRFERRLLAGTDGQVVARVRPVFVPDIDVERTATTQGEVVDFGDISVPMTVIAGRVTYGSTTPVVFPSVFARRDGGSTHFAYLSREDGTYLFIGIPPGNYTVTATDDEGLEGSIEVSLAASDSVVTNADIQLPELGTLTIQVIGRDGQPADYANVVVRSGPSFERQLGWFAESEDGGSFTVTVPLGTIVVEAEALECADPNWWDTCTAINGTASVEVSDVTTGFTVTIDLSRFGSIGFVNVTRQGGAPLPGPLEVSWLGAPHPYFLTPQRTGAAVFENGEWRLDGVPSGNIRVALRSGNYVTYSDEVGPDSDTGWSSGPWELFEGQRVRFGIFDDDFEPLANRTMLVIIESELGERRFVATTDGAGELVVEGLWPHDMSRVRFLVLDDGTGYEVEVWPDGSPEMYVEVFNINM